MIEPFFLCSSKGNTKEIVIVHRYWIIGDSIQKKQFNFMFSKSLLLNSAY